MYLFLRELLNDGIAVLAISYVHSWFEIYHSLGFIDDNVFILLCFLLHVRYCFFPLNFNIFFSIWFW